MNVIFRLGEGTVAEVRDELEDPPSYSAVRTQLGILEEKGQLTHRTDGRRYVYKAVESSSRAGKRELKGLLRTFFGDSPTAAVATLLDMEADELTDEELEDLGELVARARRQRDGGAR